MRFSSRGLAWLALLAGVAPVWSQPAAPPPVEREPILRVEAGGPTAFVTALAFSRDGKTLYAAGYDKVVRVWTQDVNTGRFVPGSTSYRVPLGPGLGGVINTLALSADGAWLAVGGSGLFRGAAGHREIGWVIPRAGGMTTAMRLDQGTIHVFNTRTGAVRTLRGHQGVVMALAFPSEGGPLLASAAREYDTEQGTYVGAVRLWDLDDARAPERGMYWGLPDPVQKQAGKTRVTRPALAVHRAPGTGQARVAIAWEDGRFRLWDVAAKVIWNDQTDGLFNNTVVSLPGQRRFLTASLRNPLGHVQAWYLAEDGSPQPDPKKAATLGRGQFPRALALLSSRAGGEVDHAAVILRVPDRGEEFLLQLIALSTYRPVREQPVLLWKGTTDEPVIATSPRGTHLAVAGNRTHEVLVFPIADLLGNEVKKPQVLRSVGATIRQVAFVARGKDKGLLLNDSPEAGQRGQPREPRAGDLIYDFTARALTDDVTGFRTDAPDLRRWALLPGVEEVEGNTVRVFHIQRDGRAVGKIVLNPGQEATAHALLPPSPLSRAPIVAVGIFEKGETLLGLYHGESGEQFRQYTGHVNPIRSLAFSGDGRLLASTADDQTVSVWSLTSLKDVLGRHGHLRGLTVEAGPMDRGLIVAGIQERDLTPANQQALQRRAVRKGDAIEGLVVDGKLQPLRTPQAFYRAIWLTPPGQKVRVRIAGRDLELEVGQGVDERKPLLSLFITSERQAARREWVGWSPVGPYDSSRPEAERYIGWHENTGTADAPSARFSLARAYRKENYKAGILKDLVDYGDASPAIDAWKQRNAPPPPDPQIRPAVLGGDVEVPPDPQQRFTVGRRDVTLTLNLEGYPRSKIASLEWQAADLRGPFKPAGEDRWSADLSRFPWKRGDRTIRVVLKTTEPASAEYSREVTVHYQPPSPEVKAVGDHPRVVTKGEYPLRAEVAPGPGQTARVTVVHRKQGQEKPLFSKSFTDVREARQITEKLELEAGVNLIKVAAENEDTPAGPAGDPERSWLTLEVTYNVPRPQLSLNKLVFPDGTERPLDAARPDVPVVIDVRSFRVVGEIESLADLVRAEWAEAGGKAEKLAGFDPARTPRKAAIDQPVTLQGPGKRALTFRAEVVKGMKPEERSVTLDYRPRLPGLVVTAPVPEQPLYEGEHPLDVAVKARLQWPSDRHPCEAQLLVNGKKQGGPLPLDATAETLTGQVRLEPGDNRVEIQLTSKWQPQPAVVKLLVPFRRPPRIVELKEVQKADKPHPRVEVEARIESPNELPLSGATIVSWKERTDGLARTQAQERLIHLKPADMKAEKGERTTLWTVRVENVLLEEGENQVKLTARNSDGESRRSATIKVVYKKPPPPRPVVSFLNAGDQTVRTARYKVEWSVQSRSPLTKVELWRGQEVLYSAPVEKQRQEGELFKLEAEYEAVLDRGYNHLRAEAVNEGGAGVAEMTVNYQYQAVVRVRVDKLEAAGKTFLPEEGGTLSFAAMPTGQVAVHGRVIWDSEYDALMAAVRHVNVSVNGHRQLPTLLDPPPPGKRERTFRSGLLLDREERNTISIRLPDSDPPLVPEVNNHRDFLLACSRPVSPTRQLAHLLIIDLNSDREKAIDRALKAFQCSDLKGDRFTVPYTIDGGRLYGPVVGDEVSRGVVLNHLYIIKRNLLARAPAGASKDVVLIYYRGVEEKQQGVAYLHTSLSRQSAELRWSAIRCSELAGVLGQNLGAQLVFLDLGSPAQGIASDGAVGARTVATAGDAPHIAVFSYTWHGDPKAQIEEARLSENLAKIWPLANTLGQISLRLGALFLKPPDEKLPWMSRQYKELLSYFEHIPMALENLRTNPKGSPP